MEFRHKNIRLPADRYRGSAWFFITFCCENRAEVLGSTLAPSGSWATFGL